MFRVDSFDVIDATTCGDAARFINHSCEVRAGITLFARVPFANTFPIRAGILSCVVFHVLRVYCEVLLTRKKFTRFL